MSRKHTVASLLKLQPWYMLWSYSPLPGGDNECLFKSAEMLTWKKVKVVMAAFREVLF
jgi:hypothetical protein